MSKTAYQHQYYFLYQTTMRWITIGLVSIIIKSFIIIHCTTIKYYNIISIDYAIIIHCWIEFVSSFVRYSVHYCTSSIHICFQYKQQNYKERDHRIITTLQHTIMECIRYVYITYHIQEFSNITRIVVVTTMIMKIFSQQYQYHYYHHCNILIIIIYTIINN